MRCRALLYAAAMTLLACNASAQAPKPDEHPLAAAPKACAPGERLQSGQNGPTVPESNGQNLSDKLAQNEGVLCPPNVDPDIKAPTPEAGKMPVIPPPGSPGGDQNVKPK
jgi:hypothetical protein